MSSRSLDLLLRLGEPSRKPCPILHLGLHQGNQIQSEVLGRVVDGSTEVGDLGDLNSVVPLEPGIQNRLVFRSQLLQLQGRVLLLCELEGFGSRGSKYNVCSTRDLRESQVRHLNSPYKYSLQVYVL